MGPAAAAVEISIGINTSGEQVVVPPLHWLTVQSVAPQLIRAMLIRSVSQKNSRRRR